MAIGGPWHCIGPTHCVHDGLEQCEYCEWIVQQHQEKRAVALAAVQDRNDRVVLRFVLAGSALAALVVALLAGIA